MARGPIVTKPCFPTLHHLLIFTPLLPWHTPPGCSWKPVSQLQRREPERPSAQRGWRLKEELLSVTQSAGESRCHLLGHGEMVGAKVPGAAGAGEDRRSMARYCPHENPHPPQPKPRHLQE